MKNFKCSLPGIAGNLLLATVLVLTLFSCRKHKDPAELKVSTYAGSGTFGFADGAAASAQFSYPTSMAIDGEGNLIVADPFNNRVRKITPSGQVSTLAGTGTTGFVNGPGNTAKFNWPYGVACDAAGNVYVADMNNNAIRKITPAGDVSTFAGTGVAGYADGPGIGAKFSYPTGVATDASGNVYVADQGQNMVRKITPSGVVMTMAGGTGGYLDGTGTAAKFNGVFALAIDAAGNVYVADRSNHRIRKVTQAGVVTTFAGTGVTGATDGAAAQATFNGSSGVAIDASGNIYVSDTENHKIRKITPNGMVSTYAGSVAGYAEGLAGSAQFNLPYGVACDHNGNVYVADYMNSRVRKITLQ